MLTVSSGVVNYSRTIITNIYSRVAQSTDGTV